MPAENRKTVLFRGDTLGARSRVFSLNRLFLTLTYMYKFLTLIPIYYRH